MANFDVQTWSECLKRNVSFRVVLPNDCDGSNNPQYDRPTKLLVLLHGYCGQGADWLWNCPVNDLAVKYNVCMVMPCGENSFYTDGVATGRQYGTFVGEEIPKYIQRTFGLSTAKEDTFVAGYSMGGYGAFHTALQFPERFGGLIALSSALLTYHLDMVPVDGNGVANREYYELMFGDLQKARNGKDDPETMVKALQDTGKEIPGIYFACGTEDFLRQPNQQMAKFLQDNNIPHTYEEGTGEHNFQFWNPYLERGIKWYLGITD